MAKLCPSINSKELLVIFFKLIMGEKARPLEGKNFKLLFCFKCAADKLNGSKSIKLVIVINIFIKQAPCSTVRQR